MNQENQKWVAYPLVTSHGDLTISASPVVNSAKVARRRSLKADFQTQVRPEILHQVNFLDSVQRVAAVELGTA